MVFCTLTCLTIKAWYSTHHPCWNSPMVLCTLSCLTFMYGVLYTVEWPTIWYGDLHTILAKIYLWCCVHCPAPQTTLTQTYYTLCHIYISCHNKYTWSSQHQVSHCVQTNLEVGNVWPGIASRGSVIRQLVTQDFSESEVKL